jgi:hypothetical protein
VPQVSKPAGIRTAQLTWKSAAQQVWKPALRHIRDQSGLDPTQSDQWQKFFCEKQKSECTSLDERRLLTVNNG